MSTAKKTDSILMALKHLDLDKHGWVAVDNWTDDECSIGVARSDKLRQLVYISSFGKPPNMFYCACESPTGDNPEEYQTVCEHECVSIDEVYKIVSLHLQS